MSLDDEFMKVTSSHYYVLIALLKRLMTYFHGHMFLFVWSYSFTGVLLILLGILYVYRHLYIFKDVKIHVLSYFSAFISFFRLLLIRGTLVPM